MDGNNKDSPITLYSNDSVVYGVEEEDNLAKHVDISIAESEKRSNGPLHVRDHHMVYLIDIKVTDDNFKFVQSKVSSIWRRYTEFEQLHAYLQVTYPYIVVPPLPEKRILYSWQKSDTLNPEFVDRRRAGLENFLLRVAHHPHLCFDRHFIGFLQMEHGWKETVIESGYLVLAEKKLKALTTTIRLKTPDAKFEMIKAYGKQLESSLNNLLYTRSRMMEKQHTVSKLHANYGRLFSEWSVVEKEMGDGLQKAGHYFDSIAENIDTTLEDEEQYADQLKEYLFYSEALQNVCKHHEVLQLVLETAHDTLNTRLQERERAGMGKVGLVSRLLGTTDSDIVRDQTCRTLDAKIIQDRAAIEKAKEELETFTEKALADVGRFQKQKDRDLQETLAAYIILQVKNARKGLQTWTQIKDCLDGVVCK